MNAHCLRCDAVLAVGRRYKVIEEFPRTTVGYYCVKCWAIIRAISDSKAGN